MVLYGPPDIKFSVEIPKSPFVAIENLTKLAHDPIPPYHRGGEGYLSLPVYKQGLLSNRCPDW